MAKRFSKDRAAEYIRKLAFGKTNDAVKLLFMEPEEQAKSIDGLDLSMVSEIKRGAKGELEVKFLNRVALLELLAGFLENGPEKNNEAESFFTAMDKAAARLGSDEV